MLTTILWRDHRGFNYCNVLHFANKQVYNSISISTYSVRQTAVAAAQKSDQNTLFLLDQGFNPTLTLISCYISSHSRHTGLHVKIKGNSSKFPFIPNPSDYQINTGKWLILKWAWLKTLYPQHTNFIEMAQNFDQYNPFQFSINIKAK